MPKGTTQLYKDAGGWDNFDNIVEMEGEPVDPVTPTYNDGDLFTAKTVEGVEMHFKVVSAADKTCMTISRRAQQGVQGPCIDPATTGEVTIPTEANGMKVVTIGEYTFWNLGGVTAINIPEGVTAIEHFSIAACNGLSRIEIPASTTSIGDNNFSSCQGLTSIVVDSNNPVYDSRDNCNAIIETATKKLVAGCKTSTIFDGITAIGRAAFYATQGLTSLVLPPSVTSIDDYAFAGCIGLSSVFVPKTVTYIGSVEAFGGCKGLTSLIVEEGNPNYDSREGCNAIIETATNKLIDACNVSFIPNGVATIGNHAFVTLDIEELVIPESVSSIEFSAIWLCSNLRTVKSFIKEPFEINRAFNQISPDATLYVTKGTKEKYEQTSGWDVFARIVEMDEESAIETIARDGGSATVAERYALGGQRTSARQKGLNIERMSDGTVRKVVVR